MDCSKNSIRQNDPKTFEELLQRIEGIKSKMDSLRVGDFPTLDDFQYAYKELLDERHRLDLMRKPLGRKRRAQLQRKQEES